MDGKGRAKLGVHIDAGLFDAVAALAERNRRTMGEEVSHALRRHLAQPPSVKWTAEVAAEALSAAEVDAQGSLPLPGRRAKRKAGRAAP